MNLGDNKTEHQSGNMLVVLAFVISGLFVLGGFAIDSTMFYLKRQELQMLAESIARAGALALPQKQLATRSAETWYDILRTDGKRAIAPKRTSSKTH